jgi:hypothetical protein
MDTGTKAVYFNNLTAHRTCMSPGQKFCTECGAILVPGTRFCGQCGRPVAGQPPKNPAPVTQQQTVIQGHSGDPEQILGIVPFLEQGLLSVIHYHLIITSQRLIFCTWDAGSDEAMADADDEVMQESCSIAETTDEIAHFRAKDWTAGPWQRYLTLPVDAIAAGAPGSITVPINEITVADIVCETKDSTQDQLHILQGGKNLSFDLMYSQGPLLFQILRPLLGERIRMADHLHRRHRFDRLLSGQEYR